MDAKLNHLITVRLRQTANGHFAATSEDLPGLFLTYPERQQILDELPEAIRTLFKLNYGEDVEVFPLDSPADPAELKETRQLMAAIRKDSLPARQRAS